MNIYSDERLINLGIISGTVGRDFGSARETKIAHKSAHKNLSGERPE